MSGGRPQGLPGPPGRLSYPSYPSYPSYLSIMSPVARTLVVLWVGLMLLTAGRADARQACAPGTTRHVAASGTGIIRVPPDRVAVSVGVETTGATVAQALAGNTPKVRSVVAALQKAGVAAGEIQTSHVIFSPEYEDSRRRITGYIVSNRTSVLRPNPADAGRLLEVAVVAGANSADSFRLIAADSNAHRARGLELAFEDARAKAARLAELSARQPGVAPVASTATESPRRWR
jgi:uncharacterized protein YggE